jgi:hypothetical protein
VSLSRNTRRWLVAGIIAGIGWVVAVPIIVRAPPPEDDPLAEYKASKKYEASVERIGGKSAVLGSELNDALASLFHGARLGYTIGVAALVVAAISLAWNGNRANTE